MVKKKKKYFKKIQRFSLDNRKKQTFEYKKHGFSLFYVDFKCLL